MAKKQPRKQYLPIDKRDGQVSVQGGELANYFMRSAPVWNSPSWQSAEVWRQFVIKQPIATICRDTIANYLNSLDWAIVARDSEQRDEMRSKTKYYTKLLERGNAYYYDIDFPSHIEWLVKDLFDLPFGAASEIGRLDDNPNGRVVWIRPLDGGTLAPTLNFDYPVVQVAQGANLTPVYLPRDFVSRVFLSPRTELRREGWGYAPPERIYLAIEMLYRGDQYYSQLLLNTPEAGIIDLGDMEQDTALEWVKSLRDLLFGVNPLKIPVLYEHTTEAKWIPFGKPPSEILYDTTTLKYASIVAAGYGLTLSDIGISGGGSGGDTLAGTIRMERISNGSGKAIAKKKLEYYFNKILPDTLRFVWIDYDDERNVSKGRARLASAQAAQIWIQQRVFKPGEIRRQALADGLVSIDVPEDVDPNDPDFPAPANPFGGAVGSKTKTLGNPVNPSQGGQGEIIPQQTLQRNLSKAEVGISKAVFSAAGIMDGIIGSAKANLTDAELSVWEQCVDDYITGKFSIDERSLFSETIDDAVNKILHGVKNEQWVAEFVDAISQKAVSDATSIEMSLADYAAQNDGEYSLKEINEDEVRQIVRAEFENGVSRLCTLYLKSSIMDGFGVDTTEAVSENIRISKSVAAKVLTCLGDIASSAYNSGIEIIRNQIGVKDATDS